LARSADEPSKTLDRLRTFCEANLSRTLPSQRYCNEVTLITDRDKQLGYCHVPKVASSAW
jgi:hypothetical protein